MPPKFYCPSDSIRAAFHTVRAGRHTGIRFMVNSEQREGYNLKKEKKKLQYRIFQNIFFLLKE